MPIIALNAHCTQFLMSALKKKMSTLNKTHHSFDSLLSSKKMCRDLRFQELRLEIYTWNLLVTASHM